METSEFSVVTEISPIRVIIKKVDKGGLELRENIFAGLKEEQTVGDDDLKVSNKALGSKGFHNCQAVVGVADPGAILHFGRASDPERIFRGEVGTHDPYIVKGVIPFREALPADATFLHIFHSRDNLVCPSGLSKDTSYSHKEIEGQLRELGFSGTVQAVKAKGQSYRNRDIFYDVEGKVVYVFPRFQTKRGRVDESYYHITLL